MMNQEQREHIATTIGILDMTIAVMQETRHEAIQAALISQTEILQQMLDEDRRFPDGCPAMET